MEMETLPVTRSPDVKNLPDPNTWSRAKELSPATLSGYRSDLVKFNEWNNGQTISPDRLRSYIHKLKESGATARSLARKRSAIISGIREALSDILSDPIRLSEFEAVLRTVKTPRPENRLVDDAFLSPEEVRSIVSHCPAKIGLLAKLIFATGARVSESVKIRRKDMRRSGDEIRIKVTGKGSKERTLPPVPVELIEEIGETWGNDKFLFPSSRSMAGHVSRVYVWQEISKAAGKAGLYARPHFLRHAFASTLADEGAPVGAIARMMGHSDEGQTALKWYVHGRTGQAEKHLGKVRI